MNTQFNDTHKLAEPVVTTPQVMKVTPKDVRSRIVNTQYFLSGTLTICVLELDNGFKVIGESDCLLPEAFQEKVGEMMAFNIAFDKAMKSYGFLFADKKFSNTKPQPFMRDVIDSITSWAKDRNLIEGSNRQAQMVKLIEEVGELASGVAKGNEEVVKDSIGDAVVVLTILAAQSDMDIEDCVFDAYQEIKDRKGRMVDGVFIKESD